MAGTAGSLSSAGTLRQAGASLSLVLGSFCFYTESPYDLLNWVAGFHMQWPRAFLSRNCQSLNLGSELAQCHFYCLLLVKVTGAQPTFKEGFYKSVSIAGVVQWKSSLETTWLGIHCDKEEQTIFSYVSILSSYTATICFVFTIGEALC